MNFWLFYLTKLSFCVSCDFPDEKFSFFSPFSLEQSFTGNLETVRSDVERFQCFPEMDHLITQLKFSHDTIMDDNTTRHTAGNRGVSIEDGWMASIKRTSFARFDNNQSDAPFIRTHWIRNNYPSFPTSEYNVHIEFQFLSLSFHLCLRLQHRASRKRDHTFPVTRD